MSNNNLEIGFRLYTLWLCEDTMKMLKHFAVDDNVSVASIVRKLVDEYVEERTQAST